MRPIRFLFSLGLCVSVACILIYLRPFGRSADPQNVSAKHRNTFLTSFNWRGPSSLFPSSAIISLTDDNSTFFLARPADFGPELPTYSLNGPLWVGNGFGDDHLNRGGALQGEGELGCSDVPGWDEQGLSHDNDADDRVASKKEAHSASNNHKKGIFKGKNHEREEDEDEDEDEEQTRRQQEKQRQKKEKEDGTDDHLHPGKTNTGKTAIHADIQSLQEGAEIQGKIVLLSRGGCGFLDKVKWAQRRGAIAVIVGDHVHGVGLVTMYARGDTTNISIPAIFTSHTTAHLLASLMPSGGLMSHVRNKPNTFSGGSHETDGRLKPSINRLHQPSAGTALRQPARIMSRDLRPSSDKQLNAKGSNSPIRSRHESAFISFFRRILNSSPLEDEATKSIDDFVIGVHDWRDQDLAKHTETNSHDSEQVADASGDGNLDLAASKDRVAAANGAARTDSRARIDMQGAAGAQGAGKESSLEPRRRGFFAWLFSWFSTSSDRSASKKQHQVMQATPRPNALSRGSSGASNTHEGDLWITLTPTPISASPFIDTLLVLVVSPLVTLTIVYALLLLRSRVRRRRWRAPKSVVERLPVRTYQTIPGTPSPRRSSSTLSAVADINTPLLPSVARPILPSLIQSNVRRQVQSEHTVGSHESSKEVKCASLDAVEEKQSTGLAAWRRKYGGKQRECVVCLEEYVDGVSRVMSLPCGHEFHEECITPWLTTRRRTCPICKGDVVRSLTSSSAILSSSRRHSPPLLGTGPLADGENRRETSRSQISSWPAGTSNRRREADDEGDLERGHSPRD